MFRPTAAPPPQARAHWSCADSQRVPRGTRWLLAVWVTVAAAVLHPAESCGQDAAFSPTGVLAQTSLTDRSIEWPDRAQWLRVLTLRDYNTRVVVLGTMLLGLSAGIIGSFTLLRRRALMGDALSHATLPGVGLAFILAPALGIDGKSLPVLLCGAALSGLAGVSSILFVRNLTRLKEDAALGIVLSVYFGAGVALLSIVQQMSSGHAAGLEAFIYGKTASMVASDAWLIGCAGGGCLVVTLLLFKELTLLCFDEAYAGSRGFPVTGLDIVLMALVVIVTIIGLQAVGLVLMIALLVIPAAAARFWTHNMQSMTLIAGGLGAGSGLLGAGMSAVFPRLPSGAMIVLVAGALFFFSMVAGPARGAAVRLWRRRALHVAVDRQHLLRGIYEYLEARGLTRPESEICRHGVTFADLLIMRSWSSARLRRQIQRSTREGLVRTAADGCLILTAAGAAAAARLVREHRLWELYLITHAEIAASQVDRSADAIEHVLDPAMIRQLEVLLQQRQAAALVVRSPHPLPVQAPAAAAAAPQTGAGQP